ncbi:hypothetical protein PanWU01x14_061170 [Parasponia andersonii]|uniref:Uncharacterized protein n=1 Tax=Parasponia andersonii TaxID=3476 RepID=A0A2P5DI24_PARAD|nr:hypothetical protein PanWU01x14_061170 [Parasponia andersonii]
MRSFMSSLNRAQMSPPDSPLKTSENSGLSFSKEPNMSKSLKSFWGSLLLLVTPSPNRKNTAMILSAIFTKHSGHSSPSIRPPRTWLQSFFSDTSTVFTASSKCWIHRAIAVSKDSHFISSISSEPDQANPQTSWHQPLFRTEP